MTMLKILFFFLPILAASSDFKWTDANLVPRETVIKADHVNELRSTLNIKRITCGLPIKYWSDNPIVPRKTIIKKAHLDEVRESTMELWNKYQTQTENISDRTFTGYSKDSFTDPTIEAKITVIKASHISELREIIDKVSCMPMPSAPPGDPDICPIWPSGVQTTCPVGLTCNLLTKKCKCQPGSSVPLCRCGYVKDTGWYFGGKPKVICRTPVAVFGSEGEILEMIDTTPPNVGKLIFECKNGKAVTDDVTCVE